MRTHADRGNTNNARCGTQAGDGRDAFAPNVGTRIFSISTGDVLVDEGAVGGTLANGNSQILTTVIQLIYLTHLTKAVRLVERIYIFV